MARIHPGDSYFATVLPALAVFGAGLAGLITPITATVLASVDASHSGIASAVNNALSRLGQMIAVAVLPLAAGLSGTDFEDPVKLAAGFPVAMAIAAGASFAAALLAWTTIRDDALSRPAADDRTGSERAPAVSSAALRGGRDPAGHVPHSPAQFPPADGQGVVTAGRHRVNDRNVSARRERPGSPRDHASWLLTVLVGLGNVAMVVSLPVPFSGRDAQMAAVSEQLDRACSGVGTVVLVEGDAGMGKAGSRTRQRCWRAAAGSASGRARLIPAMAWSNWRP